MKVSYIRYDYNDKGNDKILRDETFFEADGGPHIERDCDGTICLSLGRANLELEDSEFLEIVDAVSKFFWGQSWS